MAEWLSLLDADTFLERGDESMTEWCLPCRGQYAYVDLDEPMALGLLVALTELATTQERYRDDLDQIEREMSQGRGFDRPSNALQDFYSLACVGKDRYHVGEYGLLCAALAEIWSVPAVPLPGRTVWSLPRPETIPTGMGPSHRALARTLPLLLNKQRFGHGHEAGGYSLSSRATRHSF